MLTARCSSPLMATAAIEPAQAQPAVDRRPGLAMIGNVPTPYRLNLDKLIAAGLPELQVHTLFTHGVAEFAWNIEVPASMRVTHFGAPGDSPLASSLHRPLYEWRKGGRIIDYLKANIIRAVILFGYRYPSYLRVIRHCRQAGIPLFVANDSNIHGDRRLPYLKRACKASVYRWWLARVSGVMSMGEYGDQFFIAYGADPRRLYRLPCMPDFDAFAQVERDRLDGFRRRFGLDREKSYLLYSGRLVPRKRVDLLIRAFMSIADDRPQWDLLIVGDGFLRDELWRQVPRSRQSRVVWTGFLEADDTAAAYHAADVLVLPSDVEPWAVVVQEAMAAGLVVVASHVVGAAHEMVEDHKSGRIFPAGSLEELKRAIWEVTMPGTLETYQENSRVALERWRQSVDPVAEIRRALADVGILSGGDESSSAVVGRPSRP